MYKFILIFDEEVGITAVNTSVMSSIQLGNDEGKEISFEGKKKFGLSGFEGGKRKKVCRDQDSNLGYCGHNAMY